MKKLLSGLLVTFLFALGASAQDAREPAYKNMGTSVTNITASTTNSTGGEIIQLQDSPSPIRFWLKAEGNPACTNAGGITTTNGLVVYISTASGNLSTTNAFDTPLSSNIKLSIPNLGANTNVVSDWVVMTGVRYIRVGAVRNELLGTVSNLSVIYGYAK